MWKKPVTACVLAIGTLIGVAGSAGAAGVAGSAGAAIVPAGVTPAPSPTSAPTTTPPASDPCGAEAQWPGYAQGFPTKFDARDDGTYIGHLSQGGWALAVSHPVGINKPIEVTFSGKLATQGRFTGVTPIANEKNDSVSVSPDGHVLSYSFHNYGWVDGVDFHVSCPEPIPVAGSASGTVAMPSLGGLAFDLKTDGIETPTWMIHLGVNEVHPGSDPFEVRRVEADTGTSAAPPITQG